MSNDEKVRVSLEQALEVQNALRRNDLTLMDLKILTSGHNMALALVMLRNRARTGGHELIPDDSVFLLPLERFFSEEAFPELDSSDKKALGDRKKVLTRILFALRGENIDCVGNLVQKSRRELLVIPNMGEASLRCIEEVLKKHGLRLGMKLK